MMALKIAQALAAAVAVALVAVPAVAVPWFPSEPGLTFTYENDFAPTVIGSNGNDFWRAANLDRWPYLSRVEYFRVDPSGDVLCTGTGAGATGLIDACTYDPPLLYLDFPLDIGKTWSSQAALWPDFDGAPSLVTLSGRVVGRGTATVPAGTFEVVIVELALEGQEQGGRPATGVILLHHQLGPVQGLLSWTGVVGTESVNWGQVKSMYR